jgi:phage gp29-like protein
VELMKKHKKNKRSPALKGQMQSLGVADNNVALSMLYLEQWGNLTNNLTPAKLRRILTDADLGNIAEQHALFADMEDRCDHLFAEMGKRKRALLTLDWDIIPGSDTPQAKDTAKAAREQMDMLPCFEDMLLNMADAIGHGFAALEIAWDYSEGLHIPVGLTARPQSWFQCPWHDRNELRLRDGSAEGAELWPLGWLQHTHKSKTGWLPRAGLFRVIAWTYLIRAYALESNINYVQIYGLPLRLGEYPPGSSQEDKSALLNALRMLGSDAAGIIPSGMKVIFDAPSTTTQDIPGQLVTRCEQGMSKAILGGTLTSQADGKTSTNALGNIHNEVRHDLLVSDAVQIASTLTSQLVVPLIMLNLGVTDRKLMPYFRFDTQEPEDLRVFADALPKLAPYMEISRQWAHERLKIPRASGQRDLFRAEGTGAPDAGGDKAAAMLKLSPHDAAQFALEDMDKGVESALAETGQALLAPLMEELKEGLTPAEIQARLGRMYPDMDDRALVDLLGAAMFVAEVWGRLNARG